MAKSASKYNLLVVAHPDDETLFFGALLLKYRKLPWHVVCVTDANADGMGALRKKQFEKTCKLLKVPKSSWWNLPDIFAKRLDTSKLIDLLSELPSPVEVFTHGIIGEYGHPHHQDVSFAVHSVFGETHKVYSSAYNAAPDFSVSLDKKQYALKTKILSDVYGTETMRFMHILPATSTEGFVRVPVNEVTAIYRYVLEGVEPSRNILKTYGWYWPHFKARGEFTNGRMF